MAQLAVASASALGLALALPSIWWPTARLVISDPERGAVISAQSTWSWGKVSVTNGDAFERVFANGLGLWFFVTTLLIALASLLVWTFRSGRAVALLGLLGLTVGTTNLVGSVVRRLGDAGVEAYDKTGLDVRSYLQPAAVTETISAVVLALVWAGMVALALVSAPTVPEPSRVPEPSSIPTQRDGTTPGTGRARLGGPATGFSDDAPGPAEPPGGRPDRRFEPPS